MAKRQYVGTLAFHVTQTEIRQLFEQTGEILEVNLVTDRRDTEGFCLRRDGN